MRTIFICGDSTAASYDPAETPMVGWGQLLGLYLPKTVRVENRAIAGRSTKSFLAEGRLADIENELKAGDLLLIQFAHNDENDKPERHTEPETEFPQNLDVFLDTAIRHAAMPVLLTPICMRVWEAERLQPTHGPYLAAVRRVAEGRDAPLIDLYGESFRVTEALGDTGSRALFLQLEPGEDARMPEGRDDNAHTRRAGAEIFARFVAEQLRPLL